MSVDWSLIDAAERILGSIARRNVPLAPLTTYKVGGAAALFVRAESEDHLVTVARASRDCRLPIVVIGRGSNMLVADTGFAGIAVQLGEFASQISIPGVDDEPLVGAGAAVALPVLARRTAAAGLRGFEWAVGVPGSLGGALRMNAGGHGSDMSEVVVRSRIFSMRETSSTWRDRDSLGLRFRGSALEDDDIVIEAEIRLQRGDAAAANLAIDDVVRWRRENQPGGQNAGSVFVNPVPGEVAAGQLIDRLGLRGFRIGTAEVSPKHANFIQADVGGRSADVVAVMRHVRELVAESFGYRLRSEVRLVGFPEGEL